MADAQQGNERSMGGATRPPNSGLPPADGPNNPGAGGSSSWGQGNNGSAGAAILNFVTGGSSTNAANNNPKGANNNESMTAMTRSDREAWSRGGRQFSSPREVYTRSLHRICLKFTTSEDEDEGKPEPATAYWTLYGRSTTIGNGGPSSPKPDDICRRMDDSMTGPAAGILSRLNDLDGEQSALHAIHAGMTCGWHIRGDRGDAAVRVGKAKVLSSHRNAAIMGSDSNDEAPRKEARMLSLAAERWVLCKGASFAAGNSVFNVEDVNEAKQKITVHCSKGPMRGKLIDVHASRCPFVFGRAHEADLCIMDRELSRKHGAILYVPSRGAETAKGGKKTGSFILTDLESTNGSYMRLVGPYGHKGMGALSVGDEFIVGRTGFSVNRFDYGISEAIGARPTMEDRTIVVQSLMCDPNDGYYNNEPKDTLNELAMTTFAAVFDGHGGDECSNYLVEAMPHNIRTHMLAEREALRTAIENSRNARGGQEQAEDATSELMRRILKTAYLRTDKDFITPKSAPQSGSTAATIVLMGRRLFAANVGDSRVVLCRSGGQCVELTSDHKPSRPDEAARVRAAGGFILHKRVMGELAITRAFGDKSFKMGIKAMLEEEADELSGGASGINDNDIAKDLTAPLVSSEPEIASMVLSHNDEFLLLACDGLFDVFRSQDAIALARQELIAHRGEPAEVARILSDQAIRVRRSRDNVSILIIVLRPFWEL
uniref:PPM-type phosphatase domain-containing protein n=1 Tax=Helicotheca tamesis TaxID=374047 RepID=A0A7S2N0J6_9STRA|mmetsp:Transcript_7083/g.9588  ORF Transcript_7083/g.9588 Transcript_7083/m.9588 type:complete len:715 (+) Transcript_7083:266-2410(+)|eukprot:CAMPEP_0185741950 /NCGR_PEP_ID=MMETSP1171-20130828/39226_1 /TAXON_ID=374046 /ORGANISM="Helicotheca tamensis, Strain CCMP826" /LENGTH=714 /DNA_ID=CAMNT_0028413945 /DNA_START=232 /DNA_END=2376 /DNA_ORIENTATION=+